MVDPQEDFAGYMETMAQAEAFANHRKTILDAHETWRQTTWGGYAVRQVQRVSDHFLPFLKAALEVMSDEDSIGKVIIFNLVRLLVIFVVIGVIYAIGRLFQMFIGREIVIDEEIVIVHEYKTREEAEKAMKKTRRGAKDKAKDQ